MWAMLERVSQSAALPWTVCVLILAATVVDVTWLWIVVAAVSAFGVGAILYAASRVGRP